MPVCQTVWRDWLWQRRCFRVYLLLPLTNLVCTHSIVMSLSAPVTTCMHDCLLFNCVLDKQQSASAVLCFLCCLLGRGLCLYCPILAWYLLRWGLQCLYPLEILEWLLRSPQLGLNACWRAAWDQLNPGEGSDQDHLDRVRVTDEETEWRQCCSVASMLQTSWCRSVTCSEVWGWGGTDSQVIFTNIQ